VLITKSIVRMLFVVNKFLSLQLLSMIVLESDPCGWFDSSNSLENILYDMKTFLCPLLSDSATYSLTEQYPQKSDSDSDSDSHLDSNSNSKGTRRCMLVLTIISTLQVVSAATNPSTIAIQLIFSNKSIREIIAFFDFDLVRSSLEFDVSEKIFKNIDIHGVRENKDNLGFRGIDQLAMTQDAYSVGPRNSSFRQLKYHNRRFSISTYEDTFCSVKT